MKIIQHLLFGILCACYSTNLNAQTLVIFDYLDTSAIPTDLAGTTVYAVPGGAVKRFYIKNTTPEAFNFRIERVKIEEAEGVKDFLTCGTTEDEAVAYPFGIVWPNDPFMTPDTFRLELDENGYLGSHYLPGDSDGCSQYRYYVVTDSSERIDSVDVRYCSASGIVENQMEISLYPNPANDQITLIQSEINAEKVKIIVRDLAGRIVYETTREQVLKQTLNLAFLARGIYALSLIDPISNNQLFSTKLVLK